MPDVSERIRTYVDTAQPPVSMNEIKERLNRNGRKGPTSQVRPRGKWLLAGGGVAAGVAALVGVLLILPAARPEKSPRVSPPASAAVILEHTAKVADAQQPLVPGPGQFLYVRLLNGGRDAQSFTPSSTPSSAGGHALSQYYVQETLEQWTSATGPDRQAGTVVGQPEFITETDRQLWEQAGSPLIESGYSPGGTPPYYDVADLPTDPSKMSAYFASQTDLVKVQTDDGQPLNPLWDFSTAATFLQSGASGPQRAALLDYMATIPGVTDGGSGTTIGTKQTGTIFAMPSTTAGYTFQVIIDKATSDVLEQRVVVSDPSKLYSPTAAQIADGHAIRPFQVGQVKDYTDFLYAGIADSSSSIPSGAPQALTPWPFGSGRDPLPGSAY